MSLNALIANRIKNHNENSCVSFSRNPNYVTEKLLCIKLRKLLRIKVVLTITGFILVIPILIAGILVVKHITI